MKKNGDKKYMPAKGRMLPTVAGEESARLASRKLPHSHDDMVEWRGKTSQLCPQFPKLLGLHINAVD
jgi:hypothetical protein